MQGNKFDGAQIAAGRDICINAGTSGSGTAISMHNCRQVQWTVEGTGTISAGSLNVRSAASSANTATGNILDTIDCTTLSGGGTVQGTWPGPIQWMNGDFATPVSGGGSVTLRFNGLLS